MTNRLSHSVEVLGASFVAVGIDVVLLTQAARKPAGEFGLGVVGALAAAAASAY